MDKILITAPYLIRDFNKYKDKFRGQVNIKLPSESFTEQELLQFIGEYDYIICGDDEITSKVIDNCKLRKIIKWGTGINSIDKEYAESKGVKVYNHPGAFTEPVSDTVIAFILAFARNLIKADQMVKAGKWEKLWGYTLGEKTLGIIGMGSIGKRVAEKAQAFGMKVIGNDIREIDTCIPMMSLDELLEKADIISLNCDLNPTSHNLITLKEMKRFKGIIINTSRGPVINEDDLIKALKYGIIEGAGLDVYIDEPISKERVEELKDLNVILSPHNSNSSKLYYNKVHLKCIEYLNEKCNSNNNNIFERRTSI
jgi:D-3-phosphoglycerate dehydrogenase / 2-oxoglutarate reductase